MNVLGMVTHFHRPFRHQYKAQGKVPEVCQKSEDTSTDVLLEPLREYNNRHAVRAGEAMLASDSPFCKEDGLFTLHMPKKPPSNPTHSTLDI